MKSMIAIRLDAEIGDRLSALAKRTGRTKTYYAREAILRLIPSYIMHYIVPGNAHEVIAGAHVCGRRS